MKYVSFSGVHLRGGECSVVAGTAYHPPVRLSDMVLILIDLKVNHSATSLGIVLIPLVCLSILVCLGCDWQISGPKVVVEFMALGDAATLRCVSEAVPD